jgi:hypothetical protein
MLSNDAETQWADVLRRLAAQHALDNQHQPIVTNHYLDNPAAHAHALAKDGEYAGNAMLLSHTWNLLWCYWFSGVVSAYFRSRISLLAVRQLWLTRMRETRTGQLEISLMANLLQKPIAVWCWIQVDGVKVLQWIETHGEEFDGPTLHVVYNGHDHYEVLLPPGLQRPMDRMDEGNQCISE